MSAVVVTRAEGSEGPLSSSLRKLGLTVLLWPTVSITYSNREALAEALARAQDYDWIVFASRHAVSAVLEQLDEPPAGVRICAVGPATAQALRSQGWPVDMVPPEANAAALVAAFASRHGCPGKVLYPASSRALPTLLEGLTQLGANVVQVEAYRTVPAALDLPSCREWIARDAVAAVTFASPSAVHELEHALGRDDFDHLLRVAIPVAIGPTSAQALAERGHQAVIPEQPTLEQLALITYRSLQTRH